MQVKHFGVLAALAAVAAAAPHGGQQKALSATNSNTELCFLMCLDEKPECPPNFHSKKDGLCWTCCRDDEVVSVVNSAHGYKSYPVCWRIILPEKPDCPEGMEPLKEGEFWTCCIKDSDIPVSNTVAESIKTVNSDGAMPICWRALFLEKPNCPEGMEPQNFGTEFWTCCVKGSDQTSLSTFKGVGDPFYGECQKTPCPRMPLNCPEGSEYKRLYGFCGTCCPIGSEEPKHSVVKNIGSSDEFCYIMPSPALCDDQSRATPYGPLWKCCVDVEAGFEATTRSIVSSNGEQCFPWPLPAGCPGREVRHDDGRLDCCFQTSIEASAKVATKSIGSAHSEQCVPWQRFFPRCPGREVDHDDGSLECCFQTSTEVLAKVAAQNIALSQGEQCLSWPSGFFPPCPGNLHRNDDGSLTCCFPTSALAKATTKSIASSHAESCIPLPVPFPCPGGMHRVSYGQCCGDNDVAASSPRDQCLGLCFQDGYAGQEACRTLTPFSQPHWTGECYDCCIPGGSMKHTTTKNTDSSHYESCFPWPLPCPAGTHRANNDGLACCSDESAQQEGLLLMNNQMCIPALYEKKPECPEGWVAKEIGTDGGLWICCAGEQEEARLTEATPKAAVVKSATGKDDDCLGLCFRNPYEGAPACRNLGPFVRPTWKGECFDCCTGQGSVVEEKVIKSVAKTAESLPTCLRLSCAEDPIPCGDGWHSAQTHPGCWTCCQGQANGDAFKSTDVVEIDEETCIRAIFPEEPKCPPGMHSKKLSEHGLLWTCCLDSGEETTKGTLKHAVAKSTAGKEDDCLGLCFRNPYEGAQTCRNLVPFVRPTWKGECFDCCTGSSSVAEETVTKSVVKATLKHASIVGDVCLHFCFPPDAECPPNFYPGDRSSEECRLCCTKVGEEAGQIIAEL